MKVQTKNRDAISASTISPEQELLATEKRLLRVLEAASVIPWEADPQTWRFTYVGSPAERILGYPLDQWYEKDFWVSHIFPEDREFATNICETSSKTLSDFEFQYRMVRADGDVIWLLDIVHVDIEDGVPQALRGFMIDITAIKREEEALKTDRDRIAKRFDQQGEKLADIIAKNNKEAEKALFERRGGVLEHLYATAPVGLCYFDTDLRYRYINEWLARINGVSVEAHLGHTIDEVLKEIAAYVVPEFRHVLETGEPIIEGEVEAETPAHPGEARCYMHSYYPDKSKDGTVVGISCVIQDVTDRKRAQEALRESRNQLEHLVLDRTHELRAANEALKSTGQQLRSKAKSLHALTGKLIAVQEDELRLLGRELHDDVSQRLAALAIEADKAEQHAEATGGSEKNMLRKIKEHLIELSDNVHRLSRQVHPAIVEDLGLDAALDLLCEELENNEGIPIDYQADGVPADVPDDQALCIYRVAQAALRNVVKHARATQTDVRLYSKNGTLQFEVRDNGIGFDLNEALNRIGLGLHSIEERVSFVGGTVRMETGPGDGTVISVSMPVS